MKRALCALAVILAALTIASARDAAALKADLAGIMPAGVTKIRLAWIKGGPFDAFPENAKGAVVYVVDSDDGIIRRLYPPTGGTGDFMMVNITADGSRVLFLEKNRMQVGVINWDGSGFKWANIGGFATEYWRNPTTKADYSIVAGMYCVNIDKTTDKFQVCQTDNSGDGVGLSDDGAKFMSWNNGIGIFAEPGFAFTKSGHGGCQGSLGAGPHPLFNHNQSGHQFACVHEADNPASFKEYRVMDTLAAFVTKMGFKVTWSGTFFSQEATRFTQYPLYMTTMLQQSSVNPFLINLATMKYAYLDDNIPANTFCGDCDGVFLGPTSVVKSRAVTAGASLGRDLDSQEAYLPDGRRITSAALRAVGGSGTGVHGVVIRPIQNVTAGGATFLSVEIH